MSIEDEIVAVAAKKVPVRNVWHMLLYAWDMASFEDLPEVSSEDAPHLFGLLASMLVTCTEKLLRRQLLRSHMQKSQWVQGVRGRIDFGVSVKHVRAEFGQLYCTHPELSPDGLKNQIIKSTLQQLAKDDRIMHRDKDREALLRQQIRAAVRGMDGINVIPITSSTFNKLQLSAGERLYRLPLQICKLLHHLQMPDEHQGDPALLALLSDEVRFSVVFEKFVRNFLGHRLDAKVTSELLDWPGGDECALMPQMHPDTIIEFRTPLNRKLVIDTKYYVKTLAKAAFGKEQFHASNLYQIYAYLRTQEDESDLDRTSEGMLLYPTVSREVDESVIIQDHRVRVATVDLTQPWQIIESRLMDIVA